VSGGWPRRAGWALVALSLLLSPATQAALPQNAKDLQCPDAELFGPKLITGICWSCMFPVYLAGVRVFDGRSGRPAGANNDRACYCGGDLSSGELPTAGFSAGLFVPSRLIEVVRKPWCFPSLFGADLADANVMDGALAYGGAGRYENSMDAEAHAFWTWHMYAFPLLEILELMNVPKCNVDNYSSFDLLFVSEAFPNWYDSQLAFLVNPEAMLFGNPTAQAAGLADCAAASADDPLNSVFWMAGCWGSHYPLTGHTGTGSAPMTASLAASRALFLLGRLGFLKRTVGSDALCGGKKMPVLTKTQYRFQQLFPVPESNNNDAGSNPAPPAINLADAGDPPTTPEGTLDPSVSKVPDISIGNVRGGCCHGLGENTMLWGEWRTRPATGQDFVYLLWRWTDCCVGVIGGG
jgi:conjugal transfer pilus assembly protein TraU